MVVGVGCNLWLEACVGGIGGTRRKVDPGLTHRLEEQTVWAPGGGGLLSVPNCPEAFICLVPRLVSLGLCNDLGRSPCTLNLSGFVLCLSLGECPVVLVEGTVPLWRFSGECPAWLLFGGDGTPLGNAVGIVGGVDWASALLIFMYVCCVFPFPCTLTQAHTSNAQAHAHRCTSSTHQTHRHTHTSTQL